MLVSGQRMITILFDFRLRAKKGTKADVNAVFSGDRLHRATIKLNRNERQSMSSETRSRLRKASIPEDPDRSSMSSSQSFPAFSTNRASIGPSPSDYQLSSTSSTTGETSGAKEHVPIGSQDSIINVSPTATNVPVVNVLPPPPLVVNTVSESVSESDAVILSLDDLPSPDDINDTFLFGELPSPDDIVLPPFDYEDINLPSPKEIGLPLPQPINSSPSTDPSDTPTLQRLRELLDRDDSGWKVPYDSTLVPPREEAWLEKDNVIDQMRRFLEVCS